MVDIDSIKKQISESEDLDFFNNYLLRHLTDDAINEEITNNAVNSVINDCNLDFMYLLMNRPAIEKLYIVLALAIEKQKTSKKAFEALDFFKYNKKSELAFLLQDPACRDYYNVLQSFQKISFNNGYLQVETSVGTYNLTSIPEYLKRICGDNPQGKCHQLTDKALREYPHLNGVYVDIPLAFRGVVEHSLVINRKKDVLYDLASGFTIPISLFDFFYPILVFEITARDYMELDNYAQSEKGDNISMPAISELVRKRNC